MPGDIPVPVILLAFANDIQGERYLRDLPKEIRRLQYALGHTERKGLCEVVLIPSATAKQVVDTLQDPRYRHRIAIFHFGGHADSYRIMLESAHGGSEAAYAGGLASLLGLQRGLKLVFLNGCSTQQHVEGLLRAGVAAVIGISHAIEDHHAMHFATRFYKCLADGASIQEAFDVAAADRRRKLGDNPLDFYRQRGKRDLQGLPVDEDRFPWVIEYNRGKEQVGDNGLSEWAGDPLFGLPDVPENPNLPDKPFRHLAWFRPEHAELLFGREHEIRDLYTRVTTPTTDPVILLYGASGVGKSSLLAAGLLPRVRKTHEVRYLQLESLELPLLFETTSFWFGTAWKKLEAGGRPLVLVLDQVEKVFIGPSGVAAQKFEKFIEELQSAFGNPEHRPQGKLILGFRKEWLPEVDDLLKKSGLSRGYVHLTPLERDSIVQAVRGPGRLFDPSGMAPERVASATRLYLKYRLEIEKDLPAEIASDLMGLKQGLAVAPVLQILLTTMWDKAFALNPAAPRFDRSLYLRLKDEGILLKDFLNKQMDTLRASLPEVVSSGLALDVLQFHTTTLATARRRTGEELAGAYSHRADVLRSLVEQCEGLYLLGNPDPQEGGGKAKARSLAHDTLAPLVRELFDTSDKPGQRTRRILDSHSPEWKDGQAGPPLAEHDLATVLAGVAGTRALTVDEQRLIQASSEAKAKREKLRTFLRAVGVVGLGLIVSSGAFASIEWWRAEENADALHKTNGNLNFTLGELRTAKASADASRMEMENTLARSMLVVFRQQQNEDQLNQLEVETLWQVAQLSDSEERVRLVFLTELLTTPGLSDQLIIKSEFITQSAVGLSRNRREVIKNDLLMPILKNNKSSIESRVGAARMGTYLYLADDDFLTFAMRACCDGIDKDHYKPATRGWSFLPRLLMNSRNDSTATNSGEVQRCRRELLIKIGGAAAGDRGVEWVGIMQAERDPVFANTAVSGRLRAMASEDGKRLSDSALHVHPLVDRVDSSLAIPASRSLVNRMVSETNRKALDDLAVTIAALVPKLDEITALECARQLVARMGDLHNQWELGHLRTAVAALSTRLPVTGASSIAIRLIEFMSEEKDSYSLRELALTLEAAAARLSAREAAEVARLATRRLSIQMGQETDARALQALAQVVSKLATRLKPGDACLPTLACARRLTDRLLHVATDPISNNDRKWHVLYLCEGYESLVPFLEAQAASLCSARMCRFLVDSMIRDPDGDSLSFLMMAFKGCSASLDRSDSFHFTSRLIQMTALNDGYDARRLFDLFGSGRMSVIDRMSPADSEQLARAVLDAMRLKRANHKLISTYANLIAGLLLGLDPPVVHAIAYESAHMLTEIYIDKSKAVDRVRFAYSLNALSMHIDRSNANEILAKLFDSIDSYYAENAAGQLSKKLTSRQACDLTTQLLAKIMTSGESATNIHLLISLLAKLDRADAAMPIEQLLGILEGIKNPANWNDVRYTPLITLLASGKPALGAASSDAREKWLFHLLRDPRAQLRGLRDQGEDKWVDAFGSLPRDNLAACVTLLKAPTCIGLLRAAFLRKAGQLTGQAFRTVWDFETWSQAHPDYKLDFNQAPAR